MDSCSHIPNTSTLPEARADPARAAPKLLTYELRQAQPGSGMRDPAHVKPLYLPNLFLLFIYLPKDREPARDGEREAKDGYYSQCAHTLCMFTLAQGCLWAVRLLTHAVHVLKSL